MASGNSFIDTEKIPLFKFLEFLFYFSFISLQIIWFTCGISHMVSFYWLPPHISTLLNLFISGISLSTHCYSPALTDPSFPLLSSLLVSWTLYFHVNSHAWKIEDRIKENMWYLSFEPQLVHLILFFPSSIHLPSDLIISLLFVTKWYFIVYMY